MPQPHTPTAMVCRLNRINKKIRPKIGNQFPILG
nr:MAG TPA: hypothetical protein [Caudoviricetes sp.]